VSSVEVKYFCEIVHDEELSYIGGTAFTSIEELLEYRPFCTGCEIVEVDIVPKRRFQGKREDDKIHWQDMETQKVVFVTDVPKNGSDGQD